MDCDDLAKRLSVGLGSPGICLPCLGEVAHELEIGGDGSMERYVVPSLWAEGLGVTVTAAVARAVAVGLPDAQEARADLEARGPRSTIFRATVRRLARELAEQTRRAEEAAMN
jgi:hypothetical protein